MRLRRGGSILRMVESPLQNAMNDEVGISPNGRREMRVLVKAEGEMPEGLGGVAGLLQGTQHEVGDDAFFGLADNFSNQALVVLWRDAQLAAWESHLHAAITPGAVRVGAAGFLRRWGPAHRHGDIAQV